LALHDPAPIAVTAKLALEEAPPGAVCDVVGKLAIPLQPAGVSEIVPA
jgi:hypothetical protein